MGWAGRLATAALSLQEAPYRCIERILNACIAAEGNRIASVAPVSLVLFYVYICTFLVDVYMHLLLNPIWLHQCLWC
jgi:hypothetical protein